MLRSNLTSSLASEAAINLVADWLGGVSGHLKGEEVMAFGWLELIIIAIVGFAAMAGLAAVVFAVWFFLAQK